MNIHMELDHPWLLTRQDKKTYKNTNWLGRQLVFFFKTV